MCRYKRISSSKDLSSKSQEDLTAIFGTAPSRSPSHQEASKADANNSSNDVDVDETKHKKKKKKSSDSD